jgi:hypothetical protein
MEGGNDGIMEKRTGTMRGRRKLSLLETHYSNIPFFQYSIASPYFSLF